MERNVVFSAHLQKLRAAYPLKSAYLGLGKVLDAFLRPQLSCFLHSRDECVKCVSTLRNSYVMMLTEKLSTCKETALVHSTRFMG